MIETTTPEHWFACEILPHRPALVRYLRPRLRGSRADVADYCQEILFRVYESACVKRPEFPRAFMYEVARNYLVDQIRRRKIVSFDCMGDMAREDFDALQDHLSPERHLTACDELRGLAAAFDALSADCKAVIWLRRVEGLSQHETARRLGMKEGTVESHLCRGVALLRVNRGGD